MRKQTLNMAVRFLLEMVAVFMMSIWGYYHSENAPGILFAILLPTGFLLLWGIFAVPGDPSRSGKTVIRTPGILRLILELFLFTAATWMMLDLGYTPVWWIYGLIVFIHYIVSYDRVSWLLKQK